MSYLFLKAKLFSVQQTGTSAIEYALLASLIAVVIIGAVKLLGGNVSTMFGNIASSF